MAERRARLLGLLCLGLAALIAAPSLWWPLGRDQAQFLYIGQGWLDGLWPYRDAFDHKPPAIYAVHAAVAALGGGAGLIRGVDLLLVLGLAWLLPRGLTDEASPPSGGVGAAALLLSASYYTLFDFWDTAQVELWLAACLVAAAVLARRTSWAGVVGLLVGLACLFKPTAALPGLLIAPLVAVEPLSRSCPRLAVLALLRFVLGGLAAAALALGPFAVAGVVPDLVDAVLSFNLLYARSPSPPELPPAAFFFGHAGVFTLLFGGMGITGLGLALSKGQRQTTAEGALIVALGALVVAGLALQQRYFSYHWVALLPFAVAFALWGAMRLGAAAPQALALCVAAVALVFAPGWRSDATLSAPAVAAHVARYALGGMDRQAFLAPFSRGDFDAAAAEGLGLRLAREVEAGAGLCVRSFEPTVYLAAGLRCPSPFFSDHVLRNPGLRALTHGFDVRHRAAMAASPPALMVARGDDPTTLQRVALEGYAPLTRQGALVAFKRLELP